MEAHGAMHSHDGVSKKKKISVNDPRFDVVGLSLPNIPIVFRCKLSIH